MQRLTLSRGLAARTTAPRSCLLPSTIAAPRLQAAYATSSPKAAEKASAQSGGSRSKDASEARHSSSATEGAMPDPLASQSHQGATGGGKPLGSTAKGAPPQPKIHNASVPGSGPNKMTPEQQREVDEHNAAFERKHGRAAKAGDDKVDGKFWGKGKGKGKE